MTPGGCGDFASVTFIVPTAVPTLLVSSECGLAWSAIEEAVHRPGHLGIQLPFSVLPPWTPVEISHRLLTAMLYFRFLGAGQRLHTAQFITGLCLVSALVPGRSLRDSGARSAAEGETIYELVLKKQPGC